ncbi:HlyD family secretion protein [Yersinia enterocolitica]|uniref:HlyD family secretion protein n=1 Tax=Yersinia enterocolitica TaxID=630 RepID=UPI003F42B876|nr:HlyD family efflux transporter periplasmic adaptor subunit [Yersinia enterocolitica]
MSNLIKYHKNRPFGNVLIADTIPQRITIIISIVMCITILLFLSLVSYTQRINVSGIVFPDKGIISIKSKKSGVIKCIFKSSGDSVNKNEKLVLVDSSSSTHYFSNNEDSYQALLSKLNNINDERNKDNIENIMMKKNSIEKQKKQTENSILIMENQLKLLDESIKAEKTSFEKIEKAYRKNYVSAIEKNSAETQLIDKKIRRQSIYNDLITKKMQIDDLKQELADLDNKINDIRSENDKDYIQSLMQLYGYASETESIIRAPSSGYISGQLKNMGDYVNIGDNVLTIIPHGSINQVIAFITPDIIGEVKKGKKVTIKYDSYPYQRFGVDHGIIVDISRVPMQPSDIYDSYGLKVDKSSFKVVIKITNHKNKIILIPGMSLKLSMPTRTETLMKWLFPFFKEINSDI